MNQANLAANRLDGGENQPDGSVDPAAYVVYVLVLLTDFGYM
jgi:hypothetical protein